VIGPVPAGRDPDAYDRLRRRVLWSMPSGLYVVGSRAGERRNLMTISWATQVAMEPKLVGIGVEAGSVTHALLVEGNVFALNVLPRAARALVRKFAKPVTDASVDGDGVGTMGGQAVHGASTGAPVLDVASAYVDCEVRHVYPLGSHSWFVGEVVDCAEQADAESGTGDAEAGKSGAQAGTGDAEAGGVLRMEDTRMNYGG
jgi:flavin reductase (DIM6/NTAB) family NADH-FMN oxidoreductase RutF